MILTALAIAAAQPAQPAPTGMISLSDPQALAGYLQRKGYRAELDLSQEDPVIASGVNGWSFAIVLKGCTKKRDCQDMLIGASWEADPKKPVPLDKINEFNRDSRFARAYLDAEKAPVVEMDIIFTDQKMSEAAFEDHLEVWGVLLSAFSKHIGMDS